MSGRIAIPVAGDHAKDRTIAMQLVGMTGFDAVDAGTPAYCTEPMADELRSALAAADQERAPAYREKLIKEFMAGHGELSPDDNVRRNREVTAENG